MEREVSAAILIAVALVLMSALIGLVMYTVVIGNEVRADAFESAVNLQESISSGYYDDMVGKNNIIPASAAYSLLLKGENIVTKVTNKITGEVDEPGSIGNSILAHLRGKVSLEVTRTDSELYEITVHEEDCKWYNGVESCSH